MLIREFVSLGVFLAFVLAVYIKEGQLISGLVLHKLRRKEGPSGFLSKPAIAVHILAAAGILCFLYGLLIEPHWIEVKRVEIESSKLSRASLRIVQLSDLHTDPKGTNEKKVIEAVNALKPDIIVFTGDAVNSPKALPVFKKTLKSLKANIGKYAVTGNFDYWFLRGLDLFGGTGFDPLDAKIERINKDGDIFFISGLNFEHGGYWFPLLKNVPRGYYSIFLYHKPDLIEDLKGVNVDLYLAGHTHGGQVALPFYGAIITLSKYGKRYEAGEYKVGNTVLYVNRGIGTEGKAGVRVRFMVRPEITVFDIRPPRPVAKK
ncbi:MAG: metallophosphoesterase [Candidatus Omnitrophica bacterium]|nr:metallophosphoesterase [Candidatus Omnitrophota bacterium]MDD5311064.1 metallophosphoesterase [Candidatus Omnitrophota bacterium]MDD5546499.1 metallophosphoesterase [Candidatus Omnitrophota bacterium]